MPIGLRMRVCEYALIKGALTLLSPAGTAAASDAVRAPSSPGTDGSRPGLSPRRSWSPTWSECAWRQTAELWGVGINEHTHTQTCFMCLCLGTQSISRTLTSCTHLISSRRDKRRDGMAIKPSDFRLSRTFDPEKNVQKKPNKWDTCFTFNLCLNSTAQVCTPYLAILQLAAAAAPVASLLEPGSVAGETTGLTSPVRTWTSTESKVKSQQKKQNDT